jgi:hypothetical protein
LEHSEDDENVEYVEPHQLAEVENNQVENIENETILGIDAAVATFLNDLRLRDISLDNVNELVVCPSCATDVCTNCLDLCSLCQDVS